MRFQILFALAALSFLPLSAHNLRPSPPRVVVLEDSRWARHHLEDGCWNGHLEGRFRICPQDWDADRVILRPRPRPLAPPFLGRVELRIR